MSDNVVDFYDGAARRLGYKDYAELEAVADAVFHAEWSRLERNCKHPDKHPALGMCERCAESMR